MSKPIQKLNKLKNPESFVEFRTIKGFKYIDKAGEIVNNYHIKNSAPQFSMGLDGLVIIKPKEKIEALKITPQAIWARFTEIDSLGMISRIFSEESDSIASILDIEELSRVGWRNYFIYEFIDKEKQKKYFEKISNLKQSNLLLAKLEIQTGKDFKATLIMKPVVKSDAQKTPAVLFDVDVFQTGKISFKDASKMLDEFRKYLADESGFLEFLNNTFL